MSPLVPGLVVALLLLSCPAARGDEPWEKPDAPSRDGTAFDPAALLRAGIWSYRALKSEQPRTFCHALPSCSEYGLQALRRFGAVAGFVLTSDRLLHEMDEAAFSPRVVARDGSLKTLDPLENNIFWWPRRAPSAPAALPGRPR